MLGRRRPSVWHPLVTLAFLLVLLAPTAVAEAAAPPTYGAKGALQDQSITLAEALTYALQDEYLAQARYDAVIGRFGAVRPFSQIRQSERRHIAALLRLFKRHGVPVPPNDAASYVEPPATIRQALQAGIAGEVDNIAMYEKLAGIRGLPHDVRRVMLNLASASRQHLTAFRANEARFR